MEGFTLGELMGELDKDASVIVFTFTKKRGPYVCTACEAWSYVHTACGMHPYLRVESGYCPATVFTGSGGLQCNVFVLLN